MASPFSVFRKNQKLLMAVACLLAIIAFVFLPILGDNLGLRSRGPQNPVMVKTSQFGDLRMSDVDALRREHQRILGVLIDVKQISGAHPTMARQLAEYIVGPPTEESVVHNWLMARHAQRMGMVVSDDAVNEFLKRWTRDIVKPSEFQAAFKRAGLSELQFFNLMRDELLARQIRDTFYVALEGITPAERWEYFKRVKQTATIEAVPVPVAKYLDSPEVEEPGDKELQAFFEEYKEKYPLPDSPEPGFREPQQIALQWFKADEEKFAVSVTDEEIKQRYEKNKDLYDQPEKKPDAPAAEKPVEPKPGMSEATKNRIRREIAGEKVLKIFEGLRAKMDQYRGEWSKYEVALIQSRGKKDGDGKPAERPSPPPKPDFAKLANEAGLSPGQTELMPQWEAQVQEIGASLVGGRSPVWHYAFLSMAKFRPEISVDLKGNLFLFWKTDEKKDRIPKLDDAGVRERVLRAWKMVHARGLALKDAETLAAEARKAKKSLKQVFADRQDLQVVTPSPFSWITFGNVPLGSAPGAARLSTVSDVEYAGDEFMRTVFHLEPGQIGVALNGPKTVAYVVDLVEFSPSHQVLWNQFEVDDFSKYAPVAAQDQQKVFQAWLEEIKSSAGMTWERKPDRQMDSGPREEE